MDLVQGLGAGLVSAALHGLQRPERLDRSVVALGLAGRLTGLNGAGRGDGVDDVCFAVAASDLPVGSGDLDDLDSGVAEVPCQCGAVAAGALDTDLVELTLPAQPGEQSPVAGDGGRERLGAEHPAELVEGGGDVQVLVGVHAAGDDKLVRCQSGQGPSFSREGKGGHGAS